MNFNKNKNLMFQYDVTFNNISYRKNLKKLLLNKKKSLGRSKGQIVMWHRGGGVRRNYRILFNNKLQNNYAFVRSVEYVPNRSCFIGLIQFQGGAFSNILISSSLTVGDIILVSSNNVNFRKNGDSLKLRYAPIGIALFNLEKYPNSGPIYSRAAGVCSILLAKSIKYGKVKLPSGEEKLFNLDCMFTLGIASNIYRRFNKKYKAGTNRLLNRRPIVRGTAMNPIDHPHGGGAGKTAPGRPSVSPWGKLTKGVPTRNKKFKNKLILKKC